MVKRIRINEDERKKCAVVVNAFSEFIESNDLIVLDAGNYGYVKLQYFKEGNGFEWIFHFYNARDLFEELWSDWYHQYLMKYAANTPLENMEYEEIYERLPDNMKNEVQDKKKHFSEAVGY